MRDDTHSLVTISQQLIKMVGSSKVLMEKPLQANCTPIVRHKLTIGGVFFMAKFTFEDKLNAVRAYLEGKESYRDIGKRIGIDSKSIMKWVTLYQNQGEEGLKTKYTNYPAQFKLDVLNYMNETGSSF